MNDKLISWRGVKRLKLDASMQIAAKRLEHWNHEVKKKKKNKTENHRKRWHVNSRLVDFTELILKRSPVPRLTREDSQKKPMHGERFADCSRKKTRTMFYVANIGSTTAASSGLSAGCDSIHIDSAATTSRTRRQLRLPKMLSRRAACNSSGNK